MHALQKGLVEKDYCIALVQCICVVRLCFEVSWTALQKGMGGGGAKHFSDLPFEINVTT
jgi:hypothetical protein